MRIGWSIPLPGPFRVGGTVWRSKRRGMHGTLPGWKCPHNHSRPDLAIACANRHARSPEYQAQQAARQQRQAARQERTAQHQAARQERAQQREAAREQQAETANRAHLDQCIAAAAAEVAAVIPAVLDDGAARAIISDAVWTTDLDEHGGLDGAMRAAAATAAGRIVTAVTEHDGTLPASPAALDATFREIITRSLTAGFASKPQAGKPRAKRPWWRRKLVLIPAGIIALWIILGTTLSPAPSHPAASAAPAPAASTAPAAHAPATHAPAAYDAGRGCKDLAHWENTYDGPGTAGTSPVIRGIAARAAGTDFGADLAIWLGDLRGGLAGTDVALSDAAKVHADCAAHGVDVLSDATQAPAPAPATQAPAPAPAPAPATQAPAPAPAATHRAGEFCGEHGMTDASGLTCTLTASGTWHWEH